MGQWFDGLSLTNDNDGTTVIHGIVLDQSALHGLLQKVRDVGLPLISVTRVEPDTSPAVPPRSPTALTESSKENDMTTTAPPGKPQQRNEFR